VYRLKPLQSLGSWPTRYEITLFSYFTDLGFEPVWITTTSVLCEVGEKV
jgi:hypothetical protein